jgi:hypothetical protein
MLTLECVSDVQAAAGVRGVVTGLLVEALCLPQMRAGILVCSKL